MLGRVDIGEALVTENASRCDIGKAPLFQYT